MEHGVNGAGLSAGSHATQDTTGPRPSPAERYGSIAVDMALQIITAAVLLYILIRVKASVDEVARPDVDGYTRSWLAPLTSRLLTGLIAFVPVMLVLGLLARVPRVADAARRLLYSTDPDRPLTDRQKSIVHVATSAVIALGCVAGVVVLDAPWWYAAATAPAMLAATIVMEPVESRSSASTGLPTGPVAFAVATLWLGVYCAGLIVLARALGWSLD